MTTAVKFLPQRLYQPDIDEARMQRQAEKPRPLTKYERDLEAYCKALVLNKRKETKR